jgi:hypothetical protein
MANENQKPGVPADDLLPELAELPEADLEQASGGLIVSTLILGIFLPILVPRGGSKQTFDR